MIDKDLADKAIAYCHQSIADEQHYIDGDPADEHRARRAKHRIQQLQDLIEEVSDLSKPPTEAPT